VDDHVRRHGDAAPRLLRVPLLGLRGEGRQVQGRCRVAPRADRSQAAARGLPGTNDRVLAAAQGKRSVVGGRVRFGRGRAELGSEARSTLRLIADELRGLRNIIEVRGHAESGECDGDTSAAADSELDLSLARSAAVLRFLVADGGLRRERLRAMGAGSEDAHEGGPAMSRRVEIIVVRELVPLDKRPVLGPAPQGRP